MVFFVLSFHEDAGIVVAAGRRKEVTNAFVGTGVNEEAECKLVR